MIKTNKTFIIILILTLVLSLVACGGNDEDVKDTDNGNKEADGITAGEKTEKSENDKAVEKRLARVGLTLELIKPDTRFAKANPMDESESKEGVKVLLEGAASQDKKARSMESEAYYIKLFQTLKDISDDGKIYDAFSVYNEAIEVTDPFAEINFENAGVMFKWSYKLNNEWISIVTYPLLSMEDNNSDSYILDFSY